MKFYVTKFGDDKNDGMSLKNSFYTIEAAKHAVRDSIKDGMTENVFVLIGSGLYELEAPISFTMQDSGRDGFTITYINLEEQKPVIAGGRKIVGWQKYQDDIYMVDIGKNANIQSLYENKTRCYKARYPKKGYSNVGGRGPKHFDNRGGDAFVASDLESIVFGEKDIPKFDNFDDLQLFIWPGGPDGNWKWFTNTINIETIDYENKKINLAHKMAFEAGGGSEYFIQGKKELLSNAGEFAYEASTGILYYKPFCLPIEEQNIIAPITPRLFEFIGNSQNEYVKSIKIEGLTVCCTSAEPELYIVLPENGGCTHNGAIYMENTKAITIKNCEICNVGFHAIFMKDSNKNNVISGNLIYDIGHTGIQIEGYARSSERVNYGHKIVNNCVNDGGKLVGHGAGIQIVQSSNNLIAHNKVCSFPRYCISLKSLCWQNIVGKIIEDELVTEENAKNFILTIDNVIEYNDVSNANTDSQDTGIIEVYGVARNYIRNNNLHHSNIYYHIGFGIYLDGHSYDMVIENNIIHHLQNTDKGVLWHAIFLSGSGHQIKNNFIVNNNIAHSAIGSIDQLGVDLSRGMVVENNVLYNSGDVVHYSNWDDERFLSFDKNVCYNNGKLVKAIIKETWESPEVDYDMEYWKNRTIYKYNANSYFGDPLFEDIQKGDFSLKENSPALKLGIKQIDFENIGLTVEFLFHNRIENGRGDMNE